MIKEDIENNLKDNLDVSFLEVINESNMHNAVSYTHLTLPTTRHV